MTAITTKASALAGTTATWQEDAQPRRYITPSASEAEAKIRFVSALNIGVDTLLDRGHGRERASIELLTEIADGCSPDEDEIFQTMESFGISLEDATKVVTVSTAFRKAQIVKGGSAVAGVDELTSRLNLTNISRKGGCSRSPSPSPSVASTHSTPNTAKMTEAVKNEPADSSQTRPSAVAKKGQRSTRTKSHQQQGKGRKRVLAEKSPEKSKANVLLEEPKNKTAAADFQVKEKIAKLSKAEGKKPKSLARAKSPEGLGVRGKRTAALHVDEAHSNKRPRTHTEESIPSI